MARTSALVRLFVLSLFTLAAAALVACSSGDGNGTGGDTSGGGGGGPNRDVTAVWGVVSDVSGNFVVGATVRAGGATATTDAFGKFQLSATAGEQVLRLEKDGLLPTVKRVTVLSGKATSVEVTMRPMAAAVTLDAGAGGTAAGDRGAALVVAAGALVDGSGNAVSGDVDVHLTPFDPSKADELAALPGELQATTTGGERVLLESFGVLDVTVMQGSQKLDVASGQTVTIRIPAPEGVTNPPDTIPIWSFDEAQGIWVEEGTGTFVAAEGVYEAEIGHFSYWNADQVADATCIKGVIQDEAGNPVPGAHVVAGGVDYIGSSDATADENGQFCVVVRKNSRVRITASDGVGGLVQQEVDSGAAATTIPPVCDQCTDVGTFTIDTLTCDEVGNPWAATCAADMGDMYTCFQPSGACVIKSGSSMTNITIEWANGARVTTSLSGVTSGDVSGSGEYIGASGQTCGTFTYSGGVSGGGEDFSYEITSASGKKYTMTMNQDTGEMTIVCPSGETIVMTRAQMEAWQACDTTDDAESCTWEDGPPGGGGGGGGLCDGDSDCTGAGEVCCDYSGTKICMDESVCEQLQNMSTGCGDGCASGMECCEIAAGFSSCVPTGSCPN